MNRIRSMKRIRRVSHETKVSVEARITGAITRKVWGEVFSETWIPTQLKVAILRNEIWDHMHDKIYKI